MVSKGSYLMNEMSCYLQADILKITFPGVLDFNSNYQAQHYQYQLPQGQLQLIELIICIPKNESSAAIKANCKAIVSSANTWLKSYQAQNIDSSTDNLLSTFKVMVVDIQYQADIKHNNDINSKSSKNKLYGLIEELLAETTVDIQPLQVFSWYDWHAILETLQTPCELWRFLSYRLDQLKYSIKQLLLNFEVVYQKVC